MHLKKKMVRIWNSVSVWEFKSWFWDGGGVRVKHLLTFKLQMLTDWAEKKNWVRVQQRFITDLIGHVPLGQEPAEDERERAVGMHAYAVPALQIFFSR